MKFLIYFLLLFFSLSFSLFAQEEDLENEAASPSQTTLATIEKINEIKKLSDSKATKVLESHVENFKTLDPVNDQTVQIVGTNVDISKLDPKVLEELQSFQKSNKDFIKVFQNNMNDPTLFLKMMMNPGSSHFDFEQLLKGSIITFRLISEESLRTLLLNKTEGTFINSFLYSYPRAFLYFIRVLRDETAIPSLYGIIKDRVRLFTFIAVNIVLIVIAFLVKRYVNMSRRSFFEKIQSWFVRLVFFTALGLGVLIFFFHAELAPLWRIFLDL